MALGALPQNALSTAQHLGVMADEIWYLAGDRSTDLQWYSRRGLLIGLYTATGTRTAAARAIFCSRWCNLCNTRARTPSRACSAYRQLARLQRDMASHSARISGWCVPLLTVASKPLTWQPRRLLNREFLDRRLRDVEAFGASVGEVNEPRVHHCSFDVQCVAYST